MIDLKDVGSVDLLAIAAHRDDVELTCGGSLIAMHKKGYQTGILDLTAGETGTRGDAETRAEEARRAAAVMGVSYRANAGLPDAGVFNSDDTRRTVVEYIRAFKPTTVIIPFPKGRHPDHRITSELARDACYLAGLKKYKADGAAHRPTKVLYAMAYREDPVKPTFVVDISEVFEQKMEAIRCYSSQFDGAVQAGELFPTGQPLYDLIRLQNAHYGSLIRASYGEPFLTDETLNVTDIVKLDVSTF
ncbi:MAG: bacillithiol biosynthesis deacetylase BshB1 [Gemmatimonadota bacterium]|nr:bacillithiol biosynthesis deacetylase BshB1 [Gemmatimonadota bacterium]